MWIRSQDKCILGKFDVIAINYTNKYQVFAWTNHVSERGADSNLLLGEYPTATRALEVLEEINNKIAYEKYYDMPQA